jgi:hypothetical protein
LEQGVRIVFFSGGSEERNVSIISALLTSFWVDQKYEALKSEGQFDIFSKEDLRDSIRSLEKRGSCKKDLNVVIRDGDSLSDVILVEDDVAYTAHDQEPCIEVPNIYGSFTEYADSDEAFYRNSIYYMIGLFKTYFESEKYRKLPLREGFKRILPAEAETERYNFFGTSPMVRSMIDIGLSEVSKQVSNATLYS